MRPISEYDLLVFDCDGVIFDSNQLKTAAMRKALRQHCSEASLVDACVDYFAGNFGKSRYHHVQYFVDAILSVDARQRQVLNDAILADYSSQCYDLYLQSATVPGLLDFLRASPARKYVASGSDQNELRQVFAAKNMCSYFVDIFGSPAKKADIVARICSANADCRGLMLGDAVSDFQAARDSGLDFLFYAPLSNVVAQMLALRDEHHFAVCDDFSALTAQLVGSAKHE